MNGLPNWLTDEKGSADIAPLLAPDSSFSLESLAAEAKAITLRRFGRTMSLYAPLYLSNYCSSGCVYCGYASDRKTLRRRLDLHEVERELACMKTMGINDVLLLTGERTSDASFDYLRRCVDIAATLMPKVSVEAFPMNVNEYRALADSGCTGITIYQETYDPDQYNTLHRWGPKKNFLDRLETPERALQAGIKTVGVGALLGLHQPEKEALKLLRHVRHLCKTYWKAGLSVSFPRMRPQTGGYQPPFPVTDNFLARMIFAFRIGLPDVELALSTRESPRFRDGMAGLAITRMSIASRTTVGGYIEQNNDEKGQFEVHDDRNVEEFCFALQEKNIEPVFKNWEPVYNGPCTE
ncbi:2-iminoacetate synthase ThiH [Prosthecochloris sp. SCSIO W1101]|uniref:2-iminoacetate synthase ThiH n=1 Tax=Prosthecochloris sp. SCSIO W1101 TaxID=2992242 RepID=UPI00223DF34C|nr:2-iminoacetate synthase ThiH [Prosthecochloris sp. SCSIO W1101]UZJ40218.1 2-iminoacetate synthase ThiH [Prosthecochloris sp. SCSIO W1101]